MPILQLFKIHESSYLKTMLMADFFISSSSSSTKKL